MSLSEVFYLAALIFLNGFFVAAEFALVKVRVSQIDQLAREGNWAAKLTSRALDRLDIYLSASQLGITIASLALGQAMKERVEPAVAAGLDRLWLFKARPAAGPISLALVPILSLSLVTFFHMALGEQAPKNLAIKKARVVALCTAPPLIAFYYLFYPIIMLLNGASNITLRLLGMRDVGHVELTHTEEELRHILAESAAGGCLSRAERFMIENVLNLEEKTARRVMVPRTDVVYLSLARPLEENLLAARQSGHTRFPLCELDLTTVVGMIHVKDLFRASGVSGGRPDLRRLARKTPFFPETLGLDQLLVEFQRNRVHMAMLVDEYGEVVGMATFENVLEEVVGPIQDEFDREEPLVTPIGESSFEVDASCPIDVLAETCAIDVPDTDAETVGGLILDLLGRLARTGDWVRVDGRTLTVVQADPTRIRKVRVDPAGSASDETATPPDARSNDREPDSGRDQAGKI